MVLSQRTHAELIRAAEHAFTHDDLDLLFMRLEIAGDHQLEQAQGRSKVRRISRAIQLLDADDRVIDLVRELVEVEYEGRIERWGYDTRQAVRLMESLRTDGYDLVDERIIATTPAPTALAPEISKLERDLSARGLGVVLRHYEQAVDAFVDGNLESSNGQLRSALESALLDVCENTTGHRPGHPNGAIDRLVNASKLDEDEARLLKGLVGVSNSRGAHPGLSNGDEALFRLHFTTAALRYLLARIDDE
jgi:hypothetical protein